MRFFFMPYDLVQYAIVGITVILCITGANKAKRSSATWVCMLTGLCFVCSIPALYLIRYEKRWYSYSLDHNVMIRNGKHNQCPREETTKWLKWTMDFWIKHYNKDCVVEGVANDLILCKDELKFKTSASEKYLTGYTYGNLSYLGYHPKKKGHTRSLFIHEVSHNILYSCFSTCNPQDHHKKFKEAGLGH